MTGLISCHFLFLTFHIINIIIICVIFMKKYLIFEIICHILAVAIGVIVMANLSHIENYEFYFFIVLTMILGFLLPIIHVVFILVKQLKIKEYIPKRYNSLSCYGFMFLVGGYYIIMNYLVPIDVFYKFHILFWIIPILLYVILIPIFVLLQIKDDKKITNKIKVNRRG